MDHFTSRLTKPSASTAVLNPGSVNVDSLRVAVTKRLLAAKQGDLGIRVNSNGTKHEQSSSRGVNGSSSRLKAMNRIEHDENAAIDPVLFEVISKHVR